LHSSYEGFSDKLLYDLPQISKHTFLTKNEKTSQLVVSIYNVNHWVADTESSLTKVCTGEKEPIFSSICINSVALDTRKEQVLHFWG